MRRALFLFGEAERGDFCTPLHCKTLLQLLDTLGQPPNDSLGLFFAVQTLLLTQEIIFFRVKEEGFSKEEYMRGLKLLKKNQDLSCQVSAICMPGVGDTSIIEEANAICQLKNSLFIMSERDFYDYLTSLVSLK